MNETTESIQRLPKVATIGNGNSKVEEAARLPARSLELPPDRAKAVEYGLAQFQQIAHDRDELRRENAELKDRIAALQIQCDGLNSQLSGAQSNIQSAMLIRDQAIAARIKYEALFVLFQAQLRAFDVPAEPLIRGSEEH